MIKSIVDIAPLLADELKAGDFIRDIRWPNGVQCAHCNHGVVYELKGPNPERRQWKCADCRKKFTRHMSDGQRTEGALGAVTGRRLMYRKGANSLI